MAKRKRRRIVTRLKICCFSFGFFFRLFFPFFFLHFYFFSRAEFKSTEVKSLFASVSNLLSAPPILLINSAATLARISLHAEKIARAASANLQQPISIGDFGTNKRKNEEEKRKSLPLFPLPFFPRGCVFFFFFFLFFVSFLHTLTSQNKC
jgi:hypothetical protein